jgi:pSer/pThr/pTyr-binding forkhead associated (FHA) protein
MTPRDCLVVIGTPEPDLFGKRFDLDKDVITIGRSVSSDIVLRAETVARHHARLERRSGAWVVVDHGSCEGTHLNGEHISDDDRDGSSEAPLRYGDRIEIGGTVLELLSAAGT